jgi:hypothetical protein
MTHIYDINVNSLHLMQVREAFRARKCAVVNANHPSMSANLYFSEAGLQVCDQTSGKVILIL